MPPGELAGKRLFQFWVLPEEPEGQWVQGAPSAQMDYLENSAAKVCR